MALAILALWGMVLWRLMFIAFILFDVFTRTAIPTGDNANLWPLLLIFPAAVSVGLLGLIFVLTRRRRWLAVIALAISMVATLLWIRVMTRATFPEVALQWISWLDGILWPLVAAGICYWLYQSRKGAST